MLEIIMKLYVMAMAMDVRSPLPHLFGPAGCGKSTAVEQLARLLQTEEDRRARGDLGNLHTINVSRLSPLDVEGVQMPHGLDEAMVLRMLPATFWTQLREGDILLLDEFLRGFPEVYNALLDILTSRRVGAFRLPKVFIIGASNSTVSYDKALEDRLLHLPVPDPRTNKAEKKRQATLLVEALGLMPDTVDSYEMNSLLDTEVLPMYEILDSLKGKGTSSPTLLKGSSIRNLIGQAQLRHVQSAPLKELIDMHNQRACSKGKHQFVLLLDGKVHGTWMPGYITAAHKLRGNPRLTKLQATNLDLNLQLIEMESIRKEKGEVTEDDVFIDLI